MPLAIVLGRDGIALIAVMGLTLVEA